MVEHLPEWIARRYAKLWFKFKEKEFSKEQAMKVVPKDSSVAVVLSELRKSGWMQISISQENAKKMMYKLKEPTKTFMEELKQLSKK